MPELLSATPTAHVLVRLHLDKPFFEVKWRSKLDGGTQVKRRIGPAWLERGQTSDRRRQSRHDGWIKRRGRPPDGYLTEEEAERRVPAIIERSEAERSAAIEVARRGEPPTFDEIAAAWLEHRIAVGGIKRTTRLNYESLLRTPSEPAKKRGRPPAARIMKQWGGRDATSITSREVGKWLAELDRDPALTARAVNLHRQIMRAIFGYACRAETYALALNPVDQTEKRRERDPAEIITYTAAEVMAIARAAAAGAHHDVTRIRLSAEEEAARAVEDEQDACLIVVAAFCGLRMGECLALRWRHIIWDAQRIHVQRSYVLGEEDSPKGRRGRTVPLADQPAQALAKLSQRPMFTAPGDLVFCSRVGEHLDGSRLRRRYKAARDLATLDSPDMPMLRFHDLRHTFGTLAAQGFDLVNVQAMMGHADSRTTARYLHARPAAADAAKLTTIFGGAAAVAESATASVGNSQHSR